MKKYVEIIGPCSKYIDGKGWVTLVPEELLFAKGYVNLLELMRKDRANANLNLNTNERLANSVVQDEEKEDVKCTLKKKY